MNFFHKYEDIIISVTPGIVFYIFYTTVNLSTALFISFFMSVSGYLYRYVKYKKLSILNIWGMFGLIIGAVLAYYSEDPRLVFVFPIIANTLYGVIFLVSSVTPYDLWSTILKDAYESKNEFVLYKPVLRRLSIIWGFQFIIKALIKFYLLQSSSFEALAIAEIILGYPLSIIMILFSFKFPDYYFEYYILPDLDEEDIPLSWQ